MSDTAADKSADKASPETIMLAPDPIAAMREQGKQPEIAGGLAWLIPGAGHFYAGHKVKGVLAFLLVCGLFFGGVARSRGECVSLRKDGHQFAFMAQVGAGLPTLLALAYDSEKIPGLRPGYKEILESDKEAYSHQVPRSETGLLFTMIAGLLNMLLVWDALSGIPGGTQRRINEARRKRKIELLREEIAASTGPAPEGQAAAAEGSTSPGDDQAPSDAQATPAEADAGSEATQPEPDAAGAEPKVDDAAPEGETANATAAESSGS